MSASAERRVLTLPNPRAAGPGLVPTATAYEEQVSGLRHRLDEAKSQIAALQLRLKNDGAMPVMRAGAFVDEVRARREQAARPAERRSAKKGPGCLAEVTVINLSAILERFGDRASEHVLSHVATVLRGHVRATDTVGRLGTASFGVLLAYADPAATTDKMERLCARLEESPADWDGHDISVRINLRVASLES